MRIPVVSTVSLLNEVAYMESHARTSRVGEFMTVSLSVGLSMPRRVVVTGPYTCEYHNAITGGPRRACILPSVVIPHRRRFHHISLAPAVHDSSRSQYRGVVRAIPSIELSIIGVPGWRRSSRTMRRKLTLIVDV